MELVIGAILIIVLAPVVSVALDATIGDWATRRWQH
jgi:hypothetical protein